MREVQSQNEAVPGEAGNTSVSVWRWGGSRELVSRHWLWHCHGERPRHNSGASSGGLTTVIDYSSHEILTSVGVLLPQCELGSPVLLLQLQLQPGRLWEVQPGARLGGHLPRHLPVVPGDQGEVPAGLHPHQGVRGSRQPPGLQDEAVGRRGHCHHLLLLHWPL